MTERSALLGAQMRSPLDENHSSGKVINTRGSASSSSSYQAPRSSSSSRGGTPSSSGVRYQASGGGSGVLVNKQQVDSDDGEDDDDDVHHPFALCCGAALCSENVVVALASIGVLLGGTGQQILLVAFLSTVSPPGSAPVSGPYFVLTLCGMTFTVMFTLSALVLYARGKLRGREVSRLVHNRRFHLLSAAVGVFDALNGVLIVFSAGAARTPPALQSIFTNLSIPFTLLLSKLVLSTQYGLHHMVGAVTVLLGVGLALTPLGHRLAVGEEGAQVEHWYWPLLFSCGVLLGSAMNVIQQQLQREYRAMHNERLSVSVFQAVESLYQSLTFLGLFWVNIIHGFGNYDTLDDWSDGFRDGFKCFFTADTGLDARCSYCALIGLGFILSYMLSYVFGTILTEHASANLASMVQVMTSLIPIVFWFSWKSANHWVGGHPYQPMDVLWTCLAVPFIVGGSIIYRKARAGKPDSVLPPGQYHNFAEGSPLV